ncbi:virulence-associated E family protein [Clostridiales Family XIII bacterium ASD5510]|uniref:Virulence-associated E family protein n=1 Tax=Hominibacterium faecale TaxID=2839743 RepID=A0A9J6QZC5_9FIRM|nr:virulence-associated E family protein [Hominibacterium faecale]MCU7380832.1 virulence-associated E family protein [Hominibacterium faecale]
MILQNDRQIQISAAGSRWATSWPVQQLWWSEFIERIKTPARSTESLLTYLRYPKSQQDKLKDVGGFVGGVVDGQRKAANVKGRDLLTLDLDNIPAGETENVLCRLDGLGCGYAVYSTRKHEPAKPRLRVIVPLSRTVTPDEYEPVARKLAEIIGIALCDPTTFQASRLMYWPSCSADSQFIFQYGDKPLLSADGMLAMYGDWKDVSQWPQVPGAQPVQKLAAKQEDPAGKKGIVGAFCRVYDVYAAMEQLIPGEYEPCDLQDRYTYTGGSTTGGAIVYGEGKFLYSHHATDPSGGKLCNAFDLVRLHKYGELDEEAAAGTPTGRLPSYTAMKEFAQADPHVSALMKQEKYESAVSEFGDPDPASDTDWVQQLKINGSGNYLKSVDNILIILRNDPLLKGKFAYDEFANRGLVMGAVPWNEAEGRRIHTDNDDAGLRWYLEAIYGITGKEKIYDGIMLVAMERAFNDLKDYLWGLTWDGVKRVDTLLSDYLGAEDTLYGRTVSRKSLVAAVARVMEPGVKYDYMPILSGAQGIGKSTLFRLLGKAWYSDSLATFEGKEAAEMLQGVWINEVGELNGLSKSETNAVKQFLSKTEDIYREAYGRRTGRFPRRCVFFGTTNDKEFLKDPTGNRRFWPVDVGVREPTKNVFTQLAGEVDQIWAECVVYWRMGETLYLPKEMEERAKEAQESHREANAKEGIILDFLAKPLPEDWRQRDVLQRRMYWSGEFGQTPGNLPRDRVCAAEIWCECFGSDLKYMKRGEAREINDILRGLPDWEPMKTSGRFGPYGLQRGYKKVSTLPKK